MNLIEISTGIVLGFIGSYLTKRAEYAVMKKEIGKITLITESIKNDLSTFVFKRNKKHERVITIVEELYSKFSAVNFNYKKMISEVDFEVDEESGLDTNPYKIIDALNYERNLFMTYFNQKNIYIPTETNNIIRNLDSELNTIINLYRKGQEYAENDWYIEDITRDHISACEEELKVLFNKIDEDLRSIVN